MLPAQHHPDVLQGKPLTQVGRQLQRNRTLFRSPGLRHGNTGGDEKVSSCSRNKRLGRRMCLMFLCLGSGASGKGGWAFGYERFPTAGRYAYRTSLAFDWPARSAKQARCGAWRYPLQALMPQEQASACHLRTWPQCRDIVLRCKNATPGRCLSSRCSMEASHACAYKGSHARPPGRARLRSGFIT